MFKTLGTKILEYTMKCSDASENEDFSPQILVVIDQ